MFTCRAGLVIVALLLASCGSDEDNIPPAVTPPVEPGVYAGVFPCFDCAGIDTTLWLLPGDSYLLRQRYQDDDGTITSEAHGLGRWQWDSASARLRLQGAGPARVFSHPEQGRLLMDSYSELEHRLERVTPAPAFDGILRMEGTIHVADGNHRFVECLSGLSAPLAGNGELGRFSRQYRRFGGAGNPAFVELEGRYTWTAAGRPATLTLTKFIAIRPGGSC